jgi:ferredoxin
MGMRWTDGHSFVSSCRRDEKDAGWRARSPAMVIISRVWIDEGCICCHNCVHVAPEVFAFPDDTAVVLGEARCDGQTSRNADERSRLNAVGLEYEDTIHEAAAGCPIEIIHIDSA